MSEFRINNYIKQETMSDKELRWKTFILSALLLGITSFNNNLNFRDSNQTEYNNPDKNQNNLMNTKEAA
ncbi:MAG: hypothetical protein AAGF07_01305 [Patescibacteria group bacterium]